MNTLSSNYNWTLEGDTLVLMKNNNSYNTDVVIKNLPNEIRIKPENMMTIQVSNVAHPVMGAAKAVTSVAIGGALLGPVGLVMGAVSGAKDIGKENQREKEIYFRFQYGKNKDVYDYYGNMPANKLFLLNAIKNSPKFGNNINNKPEINEKKRAISNTKPTKNRASRDNRGNNNADKRSNININPDNPEPTINRIKLFLEDSEWNEALRYCEAAFDLFPTNSSLYLLKFCADNKLSGIDNIETKPFQYINNDKTFHKALRFSGDGPEDAKAIYEKTLKRQYDNAIQAAEEAKTSEDYFIVLNQLKDIQSYQPAEEQIKSLKQVALELLYSETQNNYNIIIESINDNDIAPDSFIADIEKLRRLAITFQNSIDNLKTLLGYNEDYAYGLQLEQKIGESIKESKEIAYIYACDYQNNGTGDSLRDADKLFKFLGDYKDSHKRRKQIEKETSLLKTYNQAEKAENNQQYQRAIQLFKQLGNYRDSKERIQALLREITVVNDYKGIMKMAIFLSVSGEFNYRLIPRGTSVLEIPLGDYDCTLYCGSEKDPYSSVEKRRAKLSIPKHSRIEITWKFGENGYNMRIS